MVRRDERVEEGTVEAAAFQTAGGEKVTTGKIVGAEAERVQLEAAVLRRCARVCWLQTFSFPDDFLLSQRSFLFYWPDVLITMKRSLARARFLHFLEPLPLPFRCSGFRAPLSL